MNINPLHRPGSDMLDNTNPHKLFLTKFAGLVLKAFKTKTKFLDKHILRTIEHGRGERFDTMGKAKAIYHVPGTDLSTMGNQVKQSTFDILIDALCISHTYVDNIEEKMNHFNIIAELAEEQGKCLAEGLDANIARCAILAARHAARVPDGFGGSIISQANMMTDVTVLTKAIFDAQVIMDTKDVDEDERYLFLRPTYYSMINQNLDLINTLYGGRGSISKGEILEVAGFKLVKSNTVPNTVVDNTYNGKYDGDFSKTVGICMTKKAVGSVQLKGLVSEKHYIPEKQATFLASKFCMGHGVYRPECAVELAAA